MRQLRSAPLGPESLTWKYFGDQRLYLLFGHAGTLQNMHPVVGQSLQDHSNFFQDPWDRFRRSLGPILGVVYDEESEGTGAQVRGFHNTIKGSHADGRRYHALDPDVFWWTHATFIEVVIAMNEFFGQPLSDEDKDLLVREGVTWWRRYGMSDQPVIDSYPDFKRYWEHMLDEVLERNATTDWVFEVDFADIPAYPGVPRPLWLLGRGVFMQANLWLTRGTLPPKARATLGLSWTWRDEVALRALGRIIRTSWPLVPESLRYHPRARAALRRDSQVLAQAA